jgi:hypothetical protein
MSKTGYVYKLVSNDVEIKECYVGSTTNTIVRKSQHKKCCNTPNKIPYNYYVYQFIRDNGGFDNWDMVIVEDFNFDKRQELHTRERFHMEQLIATLNKQKPGRTQKEYNQDNKTAIKKKMDEYRHNNKEQIAKKTKEYKQKNRVEISKKNRERSKIYYNQHKEEINKKRRKPRIKKTKEEINEKAKEKFTCDCGSIVRKDAKARHQKTQRHKDYLETLN